MTNEEAAKILKLERDSWRKNPKLKVDQRLYDAVDAAIKALEQKPCEDCISRDLMTNTLGATCIAKRDEKGDLIALCSIDNLPSVTPQPRKGHWIRIGDRDFGYRDIVICKCSECGDEKKFTGKFELEGHRLVIDMDHVYKFCPNCGAKMAESEEQI